MPLKILIVEDDAPSLELMTEVLASVEAEVRPMNDSLAAAAIILKERFDGIFLDLNMPKLDGFALMSRIRESPSNKSTPIIVVTGRDEKKTMQDAFAAGASFYIQKPIDRQKLLRLFRSARGTMVDNRRKFVRIPLKATVTCDFKGQSTKGTSWNISQGGLLFEGPNLRPLDEIHLSIQLPTTGITIQTSGVVVRVDERGRVGVRFASMNDAGREAIRQLVDQDKE